MVRRFDVLTCGSPSISLWGASVNPFSGRRCLKPPPFCRYFWLTHFLSWWRSCHRSSRGSSLCLNGLGELCGWQHRFFLALIRDLHDFFLIKWILTSGMFGVWPCGILCPSLPELKSGSRPHALSAGPQAHLCTAPCFHFSVAVLCSCCHGGCLDCFLSFNSCRSACLGFCWRKLDTVKRKESWKMLARCLFSD